MVLAVGSPLESQPQISDNLQEVNLQVSSDSLRLAWIS